MATWTEARTKTFTAGEDLEAYRRVKLSSTFDEVEYADAADFTFIGFTIASAKEGDKVAVSLGNATGTFLCEAYGANSAGAAVYPSNDGRVAATGSVPSIGRALSASTKTGDYIEVMPWPVTATEDHQTRITAAEGDIGTLQTDVGTAEGEIDDLQAADTLTIEAGEALEANRLVKLSTGTAVYADGADGASVIGVTLAGAESAADATIKRLNGNGKCEVEALAAFAQGAPLYLVNDGKVDDEGTTLIGIALEAAVDPGDIVDVLITPWPQLAAGA